MVERVHQVNKLLLRLGVAGAVVYGAVWAVRKYKLADKAEELTQRGVDLAVSAYQQAVVLTDVAATKLATSWLDPVDKEEPEDKLTEEEPEDKSAEEEPQSDTYTHKGPLLDDGHPEGAAP
jgi:urease accessory protein UreF